MRLCDIAMATRFLGQVAAKAHKSKARQLPLSVVRQLYKELYNVIVQQWTAMTVVIMRGLPAHLDAQRNELQHSMDKLSALYNKHQATLSTTEDAFNAAVYDTLLDLTREMAEYLSEAFFGCVSVLFTPALADTKACVADVKCVQLATVVLSDPQGVVTAFQKATHSIARLGESVSRVRAGYPPLDSPLFIFMSEAFDHLNTVNSELANAVNAALRVIVNIPVHEIEAMSESQRHTRAVTIPEVTHLIDTVTLVITVAEDAAAHIRSEQDVLKDVSPLSLYTALAMQSAQAEVLKEQLHQEKVQQIRDSGAAARVSRLRLDDKAVVSQTVATLASNADEVGVHLHNIQHNVAQRDIRSLRIAADAARPSLGDYFKTLSTALQEEEAILNKDVQSNSAKATAAVAAVKPNATPAEVRPAAIEARNWLELAIERLQPTQTKRAFDGFSSPAFLQHIQAARKHAATLPNQSTPPNSNLTQPSVVEKVANTNAELVLAVQEKLVVMREHSKSDQTAQQAVFDKVSAILQEPNNGELELELFDALDAIEDHVDGVMSKMLPLSASEETLVDHDEDTTTAAAAAAPQAGLMGVVPVSVPTSTSSGSLADSARDLSKSASNNSLTATPGVTRSSFSDSSGRDSIRRTGDKVLIQGSSVREFVNGFQELSHSEKAALAADKAAAAAPAATPQLQKSESKSSVGASSTVGANTVDYMSLRRHGSTQSLFAETDLPQFETGPLGEDRVTLGTLNQLLKRLTDPGSIDILFTNAFIVACSNFVTAERFMEKMIQRYYNPSMLDDTDGSEYDEATKYPIQERVCIMIKKWIDENYDPEEPSMLRVRGQIFEFFDKVSTQRGNQNLLNMIKRAIEKKEIKVEKTKAEAAKPKSPVGSLQGIKASGSKWRIAAKLLRIESVLHSDDYDIAIQLAHMNAELLKQIKMSEFRKLAWTKSDRSTKSTHVLAMIEFFNRVSVWVAYSILKEKKLKRRVTTMSKMVSIACFLRDLNDFQGVMSILAGLSMASIKRLKWTFRLMPRRTIKRLEDLEKEMSSERSYSVYRAALVGAQGARIPFLGVTLSDLTFIEEGNADYIDKNINFAKQMMFYDVVTSIQSYQRHASYTVEEARFPVAESIDLANTEMNESGLYEYSLLIEPRNAKRKEIV